jgi:hypothetical protein
MKRCPYPVNLVETAEVKGPPHLAHTFRTQQLNAA